jgi:hypothetical protein
MVPHMAILLPVHIQHVQTKDEQIEVHLQLYQGNMIQLLDKAAKHRIGWRDSTVDSASCVTELHRVCVALNSLVTAHL